MNINNLTTAFPTVKNIIYSKEYKYQKQDFCTVMKQIKGNKDLFDNLLSILTDKIKPFINDIDIFTSVPKFKHSKNDFDYSYYMAQTISTKLNKPFINDIFIKTKETKKLRTLNYDLRKEEISGAFKINFNDSSKKICIIDDVLSSGATLQELISVLKNNNFSNISVAVLVIQNIN